MTGSNFKNMERGSGTALAITMITGIFAAGFLVFVLAVSYQARFQAQMAADLGALAGASAVRVGFLPCPIVEETIRRNKGIPITCKALPFGEIIVTAQREVNIIGNNAAQANSRAGARGIAQN